MPRRLSLEKCFANAFDKDCYTDQAVEGLTKLMNHATHVEVEHGTESPEQAEVMRQIPVQERLAMAKKEGRPIFDQLGSLKLTIPDEEE
jgi:hypothetical protein